MRRVQMVHGAHRLDHRSAPSTAEITSPKPQKIGPISGDYMQSTPATARAEAPLHLVSLRDIDSGLKDHRYPLVCGLAALIFRFLTHRDIE